MARLALFPGLLVLFAVFHLAICAPPHSLDTPSGRGGYLIAEDAEIVRLDARAARATTTSASSAGAKSTTTTIATTAKPAATSASYELQCRCVSRVGRCMAPREATCGLTPEACQSSCRCAPDGRSYTCQVPGAVFPSSSGAATTAAPSTGTTPPPSTGPAGGACLGPEDVRRACPAAQDDAGAGGGGFRAETMGCRCVPRAAGVLAQ